MNFGVTLVSGSFGSGKTFATFLGLYGHSRDNTFIISNVPYAKNNIYFSNELELVKVIELLEEYMQTTNKDLLSYFTNSSSYKDIVFVIDEAHLYFDSRHALTKGGNMERLGLMLTQCRKRKVKFYIITQRLTNIDIRIRRLSDYVDEYRRYNFLGLLKWVRKRTYENLGDIADLEADNVIRFTDGEAVTYKKEALIDSGFFRPLTTLLNIFVFLDKKYRHIIKEEHLTYHVVGLESNVATNVYDYDGPSFISDLVVDNKKQYIDPNTGTVSIIEATKTEEKTAFLEALEQAKEESSVEEEYIPAYIEKQQSLSITEDVQSKKRLFIKN